MKTSKQQPGWTHEADTGIECGIAGAADIDPDVSLVMDNADKSIEIIMYMDYGYEYRLTITPEQVRRLRACCDWILERVEPDDAN